MRRIVALPFALAMCAIMAVSASAADYSFKTEQPTNFYKSTNYEDLYDSSYNYGSRNQIDFDIPEIKYGLAQDFLEHSLTNPYLGSGIHYGISVTPGAGSVIYPTMNDALPVIGTTGTIDWQYTPSVTVDDIKQKDGTLGSVSISRVGLSAKIFEGATDTSMSKGAGHYTGSGLWDGNVALFGHNRGSAAYFGKLKDVLVGDTVKYTTSLGTKTYQVTHVGSISYTDYSYLNEMGDNRITLITCIANQPSLRLCVQAVEVK